MNKLISILPEIENKEKEIMIAIKQFIHEEKYVLWKHLVNPYYDSPKKFKETIIDPKIKTHKEWMGKKINEAWAKDNYKTNKELIKNNKEQ